MRVYASLSHFVTRDWGHAFQNRMVKSTTAFELISSMSGASCNDLLAFIAVAREKSFTRAAAMSALDVSNPLQKTYKAGNIAYWPPAPGFAIYYTVAGPPIPGDSLALLGSIDTNLDIFSHGSTEVTI